VLFGFNVEEFEVLDCPEYMAHSSAYARILCTRGVPHFPDIHFIPLAFNMGKANSP